MTRQVTDQLYIDLGYLTPEDYYTYQAEAVSEQLCETSVTCSLGQLIDLDSQIIVEFTSSCAVDKIIQLNSDLTVEATSTANVNVVAGGEVAMGYDVTPFATINCTLSNIYGADLFAFSEAALGVQVDRIRDNNTQVSCVFSVTTDASRTITFSSEEDANFTVAIDNLRVRYQEAAVSAAFSLASTPSKIIKLNSSMSSTVTLQVINTRYKNTSATLSSQVTISCKEVKITSINPYGTPFQGGTRGTIEFSPTIKKFGSHSLKFNTLPVGTYSPFVAFQNRPEWTTWNTLDFWFYVATPPNVELITLIEKVNSWKVQFKRDPSTQLGVIWYTIGGNTYVTQTFNFNTWNHIRITRVPAGGSRIYLNGQRQSSFPVSTLPSGTGQLRIGTTDTQVGYNPFYIDEVLITDQLLTPLADTTITLPSTAWVDNDILLSGGSLLTHFDNSYRNTSSLYLASANATINSIAALTADLVAVQEQSANLSSAFSVTSKVTKIKQLDSSISSTTNCSASLVKVKSLQAAFESIATSLAAVGTLIKGGINLEAKFTQSATVIKIASPKLNVNVTATLTFQGGLSKQTSATMVCSSTQVCSTTKVKQFSSSITSTSQVTCNTSVKSDNIAVINSTATLEMDVGLIRGAAAMYVSDITLTASLDKLSLGQAELTSTTELAASLTTAKDITANLLVEGFALIVAREFNIGTSETFVIPRENTYWLIPAESNYYTVQIEQRTYTVEEI